jgi:ABC-type multidrug transport system permease subunit
MHIGTIAAFFMLVIGFVLGFIASYSWLASNFLWTAIGLLLFLFVRETTLSQLRDRGVAPPRPPTPPPPPSPPPPPAGTRQ